MVKAEFISKKFQICSDASNELIFHWEESEEQLISKKWGVDLDNFKKILVKKDLEDYYKLLLGYLSGQKHLLSRYNKNNPKPEETNDESREKRDNLFELAKMLRFLLDDSKGRINFLKINKQKADSTDTKNDRVLISIKESITERIERDFRMLNGHMDQLTDIEATIQLRERQDPDWLISWNNSRYYTDKDEKLLIPISLDIDDDTILKYVDTNDFTTGAEVKRLLINDYAYDHEIERELTQEYLKKVIAKYSKPKKTRGGQQKHFEAKRIIQVLANIIWTEYCFREFNKGKTEFSFKFTATEYRFVIDVFSAWGLFDACQITLPKTYLVEKYLDETFSPDPDKFEKDIYPRIKEFHSLITI